MTKTNLPSLISDLYKTYSLIDCHIWFRTFVPIKCLPRPCNFTLLASKLASRVPKDPLLITPHSSSLLVTPHHASSSLIPRHYSLLLWSCSSCYSPVLCTSPHPLLLSSCYSYSECSGLRLSSFYLTSW